MPSHTHAHCQRQIKMTRPILHVDIIHKLLQFGIVVRSLKCVRVCVLDVSAANRKVLVIIIGFAGDGDFAAQRVHTAIGRRTHARVSGTCEPPLSESVDILINRSTRLQRVSAGPVVAGAEPRRKRRMCVLRRCACGASLADASPRHRHHFTALRDYHKKTSIKAHAAPERRVRTYRGTMDRALFYYILSNCERSKHAHTSTHSHGRTSFIFNAIEMPRACAAIN